MTGLMSAMSDELEWNEKGEDVYEARSGQRHYVDDARRNSPGVLIEIPHLRAWSV